MSDLLQWEEALMDDAAGANGGPRTLKQAIRQGRQQRQAQRSYGTRYCYVCGSVWIGNACTRDGCIWSAARRIK